MELLRASLVLGISTAIRLGANLAVVKVIALVLGTEGLGQLGQFMSMIALVSALAGGGIALGVTRHVAEQQGGRGTGTPHLHAAAVIWLATGLLFAALLAIGAGPLSTWLLGTAAYAPVFWGMAACQFAIGATNLLSAVINGRQDVRGLAAAQTLSAIAGAALTTGLVAWAGLAGAMWGLLLGPSLAVLFVAARVRRKGYLQRGWLQGAQPRHYRDLLRYTGMVVVAVCTMPLAQVLLRTWQADALGWHQAGIWQGLVKLSDAWLQLGMLVLVSWYYPRVSQAATPQALHAHVRSTFLAFAALLVPAALAIWLLRDLVIRLLFTEDFRAMGDLMAAQLAGDVLRTLGSILGYIALAKARTRLYVGAEVFNAGTVLLLSHLLIPVLGPQGVPVAYFATFALYCAIGLAIYGRWHRRHVQGAAEQLPQSTPP